MPKKMHEIKKAIKREHPGVSEDQAWAMAQAAYKKMKKRRKGKK